MEDEKAISTPATPRTSTGSATETHGANTNLDSNLQGGPATSADQAKAREIEQQNTGESTPDHGDDRTEKSG